jgi:uncharacterized protein (DUF1697 family)
MTHCVALLRGINVSGQKSIRMADLRRLFEALGHTEVVTYIQSGNVVFATDADPALQSGRIEAAVRAAYGFDVPVVVRTADAWRATVAANPYAQEGVDVGRLHVALLSAPPTDAAAARLASIDGGGDACFLLGADVYLNLEKRYGETTYANANLEAKLGVRATTRNWKTMLALQALLP